MVTEEEGSEEIIVKILEEGSKDQEEKDLVDKPEVEPEVDSDEEVEADSKKQGIDKYDDYTKLSDKEKVKYGF